MKLLTVGLFAAAVVLAALADRASAQIVALGASNTAGDGVGASNAFPAQLESMLHARGARVRVQNAGVSGDTTEGMLARLSSSVPEGTGIVILQFGANDVRRGISSSARQANIAKIQHLLRSRGIRTVQADGLVAAALRAGMAQGDRIHLSIEGHHRVASQLLGSVK